MRLLLISVVIYGYLFSQMPSKEFNSWTILQDDEIWIGYVETDFPWCRSSSNHPININEILLIIENVDDYHKILDSVIYSKKDENDIAHIRIKYPFPLKYCKTISVDPLDNLENTNMDLPA